MYHEPWAASRNMDSTGNMVKIEPKIGPKNSILARFPQVLPRATQVSGRHPGLMIHHFEAIDACFDNLMNLTIF